MNNKMYKKVKFEKSCFNVRNVEVGESIEVKIARRLLAGEDTEESLADGRVGLMYNESGDGVSAETNIRTDRFEVALDAMTKNSERKNVAKRAEMKIVKDEAETADDNNNDVA